MKAKNPSIAVHHVIGSRGVTRIEINLPKHGEYNIEAILLNAENEIVEGLKANDDDAIIEHLVDNFGIDLNVVRNAVKFRRNYEGRMLAAEQHNDEQEKLYGGLAHEFVAGNTNYSVVVHAERRVAQTNDPDIITQQFYAVYAQDTREPDPDKALLGSAMCDTEYECIVWVRNMIEKDLITEFANGTITI